MKIQSKKTNFQILSQSDLKSLKGGTDKDASIIGDYDIG